MLELEEKGRKIALKDEQGKAVKQLHHWTYLHNEQPRLFGLCAFALFTVRWANLFQPHVRWLIPKVWTHNWANFNSSESLSASTDGVFGSRLAVTSYFDVAFDQGF